MERLLACFSLAILSRAAESTGFLLDLTLPSECKKQKPCFHSGSETIVRFCDWLISNRSVVGEAGKGLLTLCYMTDNFVSEVHHGNMNQQNSSVGGAVVTIIVIYQHSATGN